MTFQITLFCALILGLNLVQIVENVSTFDEAAVIECGNIHHIELQNFPQANASFSNGKCRLTCWIGNTILATDSIYEGRSCPEDMAGICRNGECIGGQEGALHECGLKHSLDFHKLKNHSGTAFTNDQCMLRCVLDGSELSVNQIHESSPCPTNPNGICRNGVCVTQSTSPTVTQKPTTITTIPSTTATKPSIESFSASKIKSLNFSLEFSDPSLKQTQYIVLYFLQTKTSLWELICTFRVDPIPSTHYYPLTLNAIPSKLTKTSQLEIDLRELKNSVDDALTAQKEDLYLLLSSFYLNHKLPFGEPENFVANFPIYRIASPHDQLMEVALRFTIVFSKD